MGDPFCSSFLLYEGTLLFEESLQCSSDTFAPGRCLYLHLLDVKGGIFVVKTLLIHEHHNNVFKIYAVILNPKNWK